MLKCSKTKSGMGWMEISVCTSSMSNNTVILFSYPDFPDHRKHAVHCSLPCMTQLEIHWKYIPCMTQFEIYYDWKLGVQLVFDRMSLGCALNYSVKKLFSGRFAFVFWQTRWQNKREMTNREISWVGESTLKRSTNDEHADSRMK